MCTLLIVGAQIWICKASDQKDDEISKTKLDQQNEDRINQEIVTNSCGK